MWTKPILRRDFLLATAGTLATCRGLYGLPWMMPGDAQAAEVKKRLVIVFTPNGMVSKGFWPRTEGADFEMTRVLKPLEPFRDKMLVVKGICNLVRGDGDNHMRGMSCLLTGNELFPGNVQGGSDTPAGWAKGISIDQEIKSYLQSNSLTRTRFGSLEFGVLVNRAANPWTRMSYAGPNQPVAPISDPYQMYQKLHGEAAGRENLQGILDLVTEDFRKFDQPGSDQDAARSSAFDQDQVRQMLRTHQQYLQGMKADLQRPLPDQQTVVPIQLPANVPLVGEQMPEIARMQLDLLVNSFVNDAARVATLQFTQSVGDLRMNWLDVPEGHHHLSHEPDTNKDAQDKLRRINTWYCEQLAYLVRQLEQTREPGTDRSMLDNTLIVWTNELGHGASHTLNNLPTVLIGGGFGFEMGRYTVVDRVSTTRLWLAIANAMGHRIDSFGLAELCQDGPVLL
jgi:hypothetical protein